MRKYLINVFFCFCFLTYFLLGIKASASLPLTGKIIVVDVGHGGKDPGTSYGNIYEKDINLTISQYLEEELSKRGATVLLIRDGDYDLSSAHALNRKRSDFDHRISYINQSGANYYLSIHLNYLEDASYSGAQVFYNYKTTKNESLALHLQKILNQELGGKREVKKIPTSTYMYGKLNVPGVLIECGFLSNANERKKLQTEYYQKRIASAIAEAMSSF